MKTVLLSAMLFSLLGVAAIAHAAMQYPFHVHDTTAVSRSAAGINVNTVFAGRDAANNAVKASRVIPFAGSRMGALAKLRMATPYGLALLTAVAVAGYLWDDVAEEVQVPGAPVANRLVNGAVNLALYGSWSCTSSTSHASMYAALQFVRTCSGPGSVNSLAYQQTAANQREVPNGIAWCDTSGTMLCRFAITGEVADTYLNVIPVTAADYPTANTVATDQDVWDRLLSPTAQFSEDWKMRIAEALLWSPTLGRPDPNLAEHVATATDLTSDHEAATDTDPLTNPTTDGLTDTGIEAITEGAPLDPEAPAVVEEDVEPLPGLCEEFPDVFACVDSSELLDEIPLQEVELTADYSPVSLTGVASCPTPPSVTIDGQVLTWDNSQLCELLENSAPIVVFCFSILGFFIIHRSFQS